MVTSLLYRRNSTTTRADQIANPRSIAGTDPDSVLEFTQPNRILEGVQELYENIVTRQVSVNQSGIRRIFNRDDGMKERVFTVEGRFDKTPLADAVNKLMRLRGANGDVMRSDIHPHGTIGFLSGNSTNFSIDPNATGPDPDTQAATQGLMIGRTEIAYSGRLFNRLTFRAVLYFGGTHETV